MRVKILGKYWRVLFVGRLGHTKTHVTMGTCDPPGEKDKAFRVRPRLRGQELMQFLIHEATHAAGWHIDEEFVDEFSKDVARLLYRPEIQERL